MLDASVLVLNKSWVAVHVAPARRALSLLYQGAARAVHPTDFVLYEFDDWCEQNELDVRGSFVQTPRLRIRIPEVIQLKSFNGFIRYDIRFSRRNVFERDKSTCQYCGKQLAKSELTLDHVLPQSRGGRNTWENVVVACKACNIRKGSRTPEEAHMPLLNSPVKPTWLPHMGMRLPHDKRNSWQRFLTTSWRATTAHQR